MPAASTTAIVSPIAREIARMKEATMPDSAAGVTTRVATSNFVAPSAYAPSRSVRGTALRASSESEETSGMIMTPTTRLALAALKMFVCGQTIRRTGVTQVRAK